MKTVGLLSEAKIVSYEPLFVRDKWPLNELKLKLDIPHYEKCNSLNFSMIESAQIKHTIKLYLYYRLSTGLAIGTCSIDLHELKKFSLYLMNNYPEIMSLEEVDRPLLLKYISSLKNSNLSSSSINNAIGVLKVFFERGSILGLKGLPTGALPLRDSDLVKAVYKKTEPFSEMEIDQLLSHIPYLEEQVARMLFVACNLIIRFSELSGLTKDSLKVNEEGEYSLVINLYKTKGRHEVPITEDVAEVISKATSISLSSVRNTKGYVFYKGYGKPISRDYFSSKLKRLVADYGLIADDGRPIRIATNRFRATLVTNYINSGVDVETVRMLLGHRSSDALWHYARIHSEKAVQLVELVVAKRSHFISKRALNTNTKKCKKEHPCIPLSNGNCMRPAEAGVCEKAEHCYSCVFFKPSSKYIGIYERQLSEAKRILGYARQNNLERIIERNVLLIDQLETILNLAV